MNCVRTNAEPFLDSGLVKEWNTWPFSMMTAARPRVQSRNANRDK